MHEIHTASSLNSPEEVEIWRGKAPLANLPPPTGPVIQLHPYSDTEMPRDPHKGGHPSTGLRTQVCPSVDRAATALYHAGPGYSWYPSGLPGSPGDSAERGLLNCECSRRSRSRGLRIPP